MELEIKRQDEVEKAPAPPAGFFYLPEFLTKEEQQALMMEVKGLVYQHDKFRGNTLKRGYAQFGYEYVTATGELNAAPPLPEFLIALAQKGLPHCPVGSQFNQCIVTYYPPGAGIGWHPDEKCFGDCIMAVSLGAPGLLQFAPNKSQKANYEVVVAPGSLYVMRGPAQWDYDHQVKKVKEEHYSITFRHVDSA